ncbi:MAG: hypothetical protein EB025_05030 [Chitinophagaceae bacterium]|nr:hypothetical protein [Chitinophagaceae bacterium]
MRAIKKYLIIILVISSCQKEVVVDTTEDKLAEKEWYLERKSGGQANFIYTGLPTFSFNLTRSSKSYTDTDGISGTYIIEDQPNLKTLQVNASGRQIEAYIIKQVEKDNVVLEYNRNNIIYTLFFSTRK